MVDEPDNLVLEHLRYIRKAIDVLGLEFGDMKSRISSIESNIADLHVGQALTNRRLDRLEERVTRIERRLEIVEPA